MAMRWWHSDDSVNIENYWNIKNGMSILYVALVAYQLSLCIFGIHSDFLLGSYIIMYLHIYVPANVTGSLLNEDAALQVSEMYNENSYTLKDDRGLYIETWAWLHCLLFDIDKFYSDKCHAEWQNNDY